MGDALSQAGILQLHVSPQVSASLSGRCLTSSQARSLFLSHDFPVVPLSHTTSCPMANLTHFTLPIANLTHFTLKARPVLGPCPSLCWAHPVRGPILLPSQSTSGNQCSRLPLLLCTLVGVRFSLSGLCLASPCGSAYSTMALSLHSQCGSTPHPCPALPWGFCACSQGVLPQILLASSICSSVTASEGPSFKEQA